jgi:hypothetical protein
MKSSLINAVNKFLDVIGSIVVGIAMLAITVAVFKPVISGMGDSAVVLAKTGANRVSIAFNTLLPKHEADSEASTKVASLKRSRK